MNYKGCDKMVSKISLIISIVALAVCFIAAINGILSDGIKGLRKKAKILSIAFCIYAVTFLTFIISQ